jgi:hypothetical protein
LPLFLTILWEFLCGNLAKVKENNFFTFLMWRNLELFLFLKLFFSSVFFDSLFWSYICFELWKVCKKEVWPFVFEKCCRLPVVFKKCCWLLLRKQQIICPINFIIFIGDYFQLRCKSEFHFLLLLNFLL